MRCFFTVLFAVNLFVHINAQDTAHADFYDQIKQYDLAVILTADSLRDDDTVIKRPEILGFIGDNYQRFHIHFTSVIKNSDNPYEYFASGKTMVKESISPFHGVMRVIKAGIYETILHDSGHTEGYAIFDIAIYEDKNLPSTGFIKGVLTTYFTIDKKGSFNYNTLSFVADGFCNNQFTGSWTSYKTGYSKKCNWGDFRIPDSKDLDCGTGEFIVDMKYIHNGWQSYVIEQGMLDNMAPVENKTNIKKQWWE